jgi:hypothetical protein
MIRLTTLLSEEVPLPMALEVDAAIVERPLYSVEFTTLTQPSTIRLNLHRNTPKPQQQLQEIKYHTLSLILFPNYSRCLHYNRYVHKYTFIVLHLVFLED